MPSSNQSSIPDTQLGLTADEVQLLRYYQQAVNGSSRAASQASSQGRLLLDPSSLAALSAHFDRLIHSIQQRWSAVCVGSCSLALFFALSSCLPPTPIGACRFAR